MSGGSGESHNWRQSLLWSDQLGAKSHAHTQGKERERNRERERKQHCFWLRLATPALNQRCRQRLPALVLQVPLYCCPSVPPLSLGFSLQCGMLAHMAANQCDSLHPLVFLRVCSAVSIFGNSLVADGLLWFCRRKSVVKALCFPHYLIDTSLLSS